MCGFKKVQRETDQNKDVCKAVPNKNTLVEMYPLYDDFEHIENLCTYKAHPILKHCQYPSTLRLFADGKLSENKEARTVRWGGC